MPTLPKTRSLRFRHCFVLCGVVILIGSWWLGSAITSPPQTLDRLATEMGFELKPVFKATFSYTLPSKGRIESQDNFTLSSEVRSRTTVLELIPAGTEVREPILAHVDGVVTSLEQPTTGEVVVVVNDADGKSHQHHCDDLGEHTEVLVEEGDSVRQGEPLIGDIIARLDSSNLLELEKKYEISYTRAKTNFELSENNYLVRQLNNESKIAAASLAASLTKLDLEEYLKGLYPQQKEKLEGTIQQLKEDLTRANESLEYSKRMVVKGYQPITVVEDARIKLLKSENKLEDAQNQLRVLKEFTFGRTRLALERKAQNAFNHLKRTRLSGEALLAQDRSSRAARERVYEIYRSRLQNVRNQIKACTLVALRAGKVVHANLQYSRSGNTYVEVGSQVYERQAIAHIPDMKSMCVNARIHESLISKVNVGLPVEIRVEAIPDHTFRGVLTELSSVPMPGEYPNYQRKEFRASIKIDQETATAQPLRPGMNAEVELIVHRAAEEFVQIPTQAVVKLRERQFAWVFGETGPEMRSLELGRDNDETYIVHDGVLPSEQVVMHPWNHFTEQIELLESQYGTDESEPSTTFEESGFSSEAEFLQELSYYLEQPEPEPSQSTQTASVDSVGEE